VVGRSCVVQSNHQSSLQLIARVNPLILIYLKTTIYYIDADIIVYKYYLAVYYIIYIARSDAGGGVW